MRPLEPHDFHAIMIEVGTSRVITRQLELNNIHTMKSQITDLIDRQLEHTPLTHQTSHMIINEPF